MRRMRIIIIILTLLLAWWTYFAFTESKSRETLLEKLKNEHSVAEGTLEHLPIAHGSGPKKSPDFGYKYSVNGAEFKGYIRTSGAFRIPLGVHSIVDLKDRPIHGEKILVWYNPNNPSESAPFEVQDRHITYIKWVMWICISFGLVIYSAVLGVIRVFK